ncbi:hypothetical protein GCM10023260_14320 [Bartonella acomydis]|uniref:Uncharacterized protein n=1 Tax=Bartonella acomydis TaxID=686234 RepID=A0ABP9MXD7_9HYPH
MDTFENRKAELKNNENWFTSLKLHILPKLGFLTVSGLYKQEIRNTLAPIWHIKAGAASTVLKAIYNFLL